MCGGGGGIGKVVSGVGKAIGGAVSAIGKGISNVMKNPIVRTVLPVALSFMMPGLGTAIAGGLGLSGGVLGISGATLATALGSAAISGGTSLISGQGLGQSFRNAALAGITAGAVSGLSNMFSSNPLASITGGSEGGIANNLSSASTGSVGLTGSGSGLGVDTSNVGTMFGAPQAGSSVAGAANSGLTAPSSFGGITATPPSGAIGISSNYTPGGFGSIIDPTSGLSASGLKQVAGTGASPGFFDSLSKGNILDAGKAAYNKLMPTSTLGKVALGGLGLSMLSGGKQAQQEGPPPIQDPTFSQRLKLQNFNYNPQANPTGANYGVGSSVYNPQTRRFETVGPAPQGEHLFFRPTFSDVDPANQAPVQAAAGGMIDSGALSPMEQYMQNQNMLAPYQQMNQPMGALNQMSQSPMQGFAEGGRYIAGPDSGVGDTVNASIDNQRPARISHGEFIINSRTLSELGSGNSENGAKRMSDWVKKVDRARLSNKNVAQENHLERFLPMPT